MCRRYNLPASRWIKYPDRYHSYCFDVAISYILMQQDSTASGGGVGKAPQPNSEPQQGGLAGWIATLPGVLD